ncbi:MAG: COR domain-containing protein [Saprospiraceae bacterium]
MSLWSNRIKDISCLKHLKNLQHLDLHNNQIKQISVLKNLKKLESLHLGSNKIQNFSCLQHLHNLKWLNVSINSIKKDFPLSLLMKFGTLEWLSLGKPIDLPQDLYQDRKDILTEVKSYLQDGKTHGWDENKDLKLILIGNGGVGKTSLVRRLIENKFDEVYDSTHGIQMKPYELKILEQDELKTYNINIWDFGGQDIYHATHRLFMQTRALFVLVWDWQTEQEPTQIIEENNRTNKYENHGLDYWLNYVKVLGKGSKVIVVQTKTQKHGEKKHSRENELRTKYQGIWLDTISIESKENNWSKNGFKKLKLAIENAIESGEFLRKEKLPKNWITQRKEVYNLLETGMKTIEYEDFVNEMCKNKTISSETILNWLSDSGVVFYKKGLFENKIIVNQQWSIDAIYTLFDRKKYYYRLKDAKGRFTKDDLKEFWENNKPEERELFLSFMLSCEICYSSDNNKDEFVAPAFLPNNKEGGSLDDFWDGKIFDTGKYEFKFLHYGVIQSFIVRLNNFRSENISIESVWQYGILFKYNNLFASVEANLKEKIILVKVSQSDEQSLLNEIQNLIYALDDKENIKRTFLSASNSQRKEDKEDIFIKNIVKEVTKELMPHFSNLETSQDLLIEETIKNSITLNKIDETTAEHVEISKDTNQKVDTILNELNTKFQEILQRDIKLDEKLELQHKAIFNFLKDKSLLESEKSIERELNQRLNSGKTIRLDSMTLKYLFSAEYVWQNASQNLDFSIAISEFGKAVENEMFKLMEKFKSTQSNILLTIRNTSTSVNLNFNQSSDCLNLMGLHFSKMQTIVERSDNSGFKIKHNRKIIFNHKNVVQTSRTNIDALLADVKTKFRDSFDTFITNHFGINFRTNLVLPISNSTLETLIPSHCRTRKQLDFIREVRNSAAHPSDHIRTKLEAEEYRKLVLNFFGFWCNQLK